MQRSDELQSFASWPTPQDYNEAVQSLGSNTADPQLSSGQIVVDKMGLPRPVTGAFASVYKVMTGANDFAFRCFLRRVSDQEARYIAISDFVQSDDLPYTVTFDYQSRGIKINNAWFPALKMEWVEGLPLDIFIAQHYQDKQRISALAEKFRQMCGDLQQAGIAHGDLQHGNIIVIENDELRLVDYDGMYVPSMTGMQASELGHRNYQHPMRSGEHFDHSLDNFSAWVIYTSLKALSIDTKLYRDLNAGDDCLLFRQSDFQNPLYSNAFAHLESHRDQQIRKLARFVRAQLSAAPTAVTALGSGEPEEVANLEPVVPQKILLAKATSISTPDWLRGLGPKSPTPVYPLAVQNQPNIPSRYPTQAGFEPEWEAFTGQNGNQARWNGSGLDPRILLTLLAAAALLYWAGASIVWHHWLPTQAMIMLMMAVGGSSRWVVSISHYFLLRRSEAAIGTVTDKFPWEQKQRIDYRFMTRNGKTVVGNLYVDPVEFKKVSKGQKLTIIYAPLSPSHNMPYKFCTYQLGPEESLVDLLVIPLRRYKQNTKLSFQRWFYRQCWWVPALVNHRSRKAIPAAQGIHELNRISNRQCVWRDKIKCGLISTAAIAVPIIWTLIWFQSHDPYGNIESIVTLIFALSIIAIELALFWAPLRDRFLLKEGIAVAGRIVQKVDRLDERSSESWHIEYDFSTLNGRRIRRRKRVTELEYKNLRVGQETTVLYVDAPTYPSTVYDLCMLKVKETFDQIEKYGDDR